MITSGAPEFASMAVENLVYSSAPWPALVQQICTSSWVSLNRSTTSSNAGYQAQTVTWVASAFLIVLVHEVLPPPSPLLLVLSPPPLPPLHAASEAMATAAPAATHALRRVVVFRIRILLDPTTRAAAPPTRVTLRSPPQVGGAAGPGRRQEGSCAMSGMCSLSLYYNDREPVERERGHNLVTGV
jgi:hypothetical protein